MHRPYLVMLCHFTSIVLIYGQEVAHSVSKGIIHTGLRSYNTHKRNYGTSTHVKSMTRYNIFMAKKLLLGSSGTCVVCRDKLMAQRSS